MCGDECQVDGGHVTFMVWLSSRMGDHLIIRIWFDSSVWTVPGGCCCWWCSSIMFFASVVMSVKWNGRRTYDLLTLVVMEDG